MKTNTACSHLHIVTVSIIKEFPKTLLNLNRRKVNLKYIYIGLYMNVAGFEQFYSNSVYRKVKRLEKSFRQSFPSYTKGFTFLQD